MSFSGNKNHYFSQRDMSMEQRGREQKRLETSIDEVLTALANEHRRQILYCLIDNGGVVTASELAEHLSTVGDGEPEKIDVRLKHASLPRLKTVGIVIEDADSNQLIYNGGSLATEILSTVRTWE